MVDLCQSAIACLRNFFLKFSPVLYVLGDIKWKVWQIDIIDICPVSYTHLDVYKRQVYKGNDLYIRLFNAQSDASPKTITFQGRDVKASLVELDNRLVEDLTVTEKKGASSMRLSIPRYGIRTLKAVSYTHLVAFRFGRE